MDEIKPTPLDPIGLLDVSKSQADDAAGELFHDLWERPPEQIRDPTRATKLLWLVLAYSSKFDFVIDDVFSQLKNVVLHNAPQHIDGLTRRMKTLGAIARKLRRSTTRLSQLQDIAGCRIVVEDATIQHSLLKAILKRWPDGRVVDLTDGSRRTGYRAIHVIVHHDGLPIEIQLRTVTQQHWADSVEAFAARFELDGSNGYLKDGDAPDFIVSYFEVASRILDVRAKGGEPNAALEEILSELREKVRQFVHECQR